MDFIKKHYEKILLGTMLVGLIGVLVFMLFYIAADKTDMESKSGSLINRSVKQLTNLDLTVESSATNRLSSPYHLDLETGNKLFNPMEWQRTLDNQLVTTKKTGPRVAVVTNITPLFLIVSLDSVTTNELGARYVIKIERQAAATAAKRAPQRHWTALGDKSTANDTFVLEKVQGAVDNPDALLLKLSDTGEEVTITKDKSYRRIEGYMADFRYDPDRKAFHGRRVNDKLSFGGVDYTVVEVNQNELVLMDQSNQKKTSLPFAP